MNWNNAFRILCWLVAFILSMDFAMSLINMPSTLLATTGIFLVFFIILISYKTKLFTNFKIFKK